MFKGKMKRFIRLFLIFRKSRLTFSKRRRIFKIILWEKKMIIERLNNLRIISGSSCTIGTAVLKIWSVRTNLNAASFAWKTAILRIHPLALPPCSVSMHFTRNALKLGSQAAHYVLFAKGISGSMKHTHSLMPITKRGSRKNGYKRNFYHCT